MKYGQELKKSMVANWKSSYVSYNALKRELKVGLSNHGWTQQHEKDFVCLIDDEIAKVSEFINSKFADVDTRILYCESTIQAIGANLATVPDYKMTKDALEEIMTELKNISNFMHTNYISLHKILKKHDKQTGILLKPIFIEKMKRAPLDRQILDSAIVYASALLNICYVHCKRDSFGSVFEDRQQKNHKAISSFWVHPDNIEEVTAAIVLHLSVPENEQNTPKKCSTHNASTIYFDNSSFDLYTSRLQKDEEYECIKLKSYELLNERKVYLEYSKAFMDHSEYKLTKSEFILAEDQANGFLKGEVTADTILDVFNEPFDENSKNNNTKCALDSIQRKVGKKKLVPVLKASYNRKLFHASDDQQCSASLDSNLMFTHEAKPSSLYCQKAFHYTDSNTAVLDGVSALYFPYAILRIQVSKCLKQQPGWILSLIEKHLVYEVPSFSKHLHGVSYFHQEKLAFSPWWHELNEDICKPRTNSDGIIRSHGFKPFVDGRYLQIASEEKTFQSNQPESNHGNTNQPDSTYSESTVTHVNTPSPVLSYDCIKPKKEQIAIDIPDEKAENQALKKILKKKKKQHDIEAGIKKPKVKVRVEPKVFFANERTFISWLQFCALLLTVALNLINFGDLVSRIVGGIFIGLAGGIAIYALYRFEKRAWYLLGVLDTLLG
ncbi:VTC domain-containing protein [Sporodiniella umbellata]|nr:VTC domain-containing protein [Sporodiniella umbellata]